MRVKCLIPCITGFDFRTGIPVITGQILDYRFLGHCWWYETDFSPFVFKFPHLYFLESNFVIWPQKVKLHKLTLWVHITLHMKRNFMTIPYIVQLTHRKMRSWKKYRQCDLSTISNNKKKCATKYFHPCESWFELFFEQNKMKISQGW